MSGIGRRGVLKFLGLSSVAAPALAKAGVDTGLNTGRFSDYPMEYEDLPETVEALARESWQEPTIARYEDYRKHVDKGISPLDLAKRIYRAEQERAHYSSDTYLRRRYIEKRRGITRIEPDLAAYKSFSAVTLVRMQAERDIASAKEHTAAYWDDVIKALKGGFMTLGDVDENMGSKTGETPPSPRRSMRG